MGKNRRYQRDYFIDGKIPPIRLFRVLFVSKRLKVLLEFLFHFNKNRGFLFHHLLIKKKLLNKTPSQIRNPVFTFKNFGRSRFLLLYR